MTTRLLMCAMLCLQGRFLMPGVLCLLVASIAWAAVAEPERRPPIIDMHLHASVPASPAKHDTCAGAMGAQTQDACLPVSWSPKAEAAMRQRTLAQLQHYNVVGVLHAEQADAIPAWRQAAPGRIIPSTLPLDPLQIDRQTVARVKAMKAAGTLAVLGEVGLQHHGIGLDDPRMEAFWALADEVDLPVGIRVTGPAPDARHHSAVRGGPQTLAHVLARHPHLRVYLMHAGEPTLDELLAVLDAHPQVYVDVGQLAYTQSRPAFYRDLQAMVEAGFGNRVMFGSGSRVWPESIGRAIETVNRAPFLDAGQKRDIFYNNAARFLRLSEQQRAQHQTI
ncbi:hypothetical protein SAMN05428989_1839 [Pseudoxanthomonas sp. GM95]|uniref:amidohydrolase family protein n=1 Tax=Pseudoxanthomonas sp. GM95 TaxID=1881043 RepID=UPI0008AB42AC|nr:amidohydrolase family protein [Pseudoxanthomonas sp. GM95]SEL52262.1 hypothetical protein SAMN05428989_1839 [Pseudoxanthomonas sp. GM95]